MIKIDADWNIIYTQGDTFSVQFDLGKHTLKNGEKAILSISYEDKVVLDATIEGHNQTLLPFIISKEDMRQLPSGRYRYDMRIEFVDGRVYTTDFIKQLIIIPSAH